MSKYKKQWNYRKHTQEKSSALIEDAQPTACDELRQIAGGPHHELITNEGVDYSNYSQVAGHLFSESDTQLLRLDSANFHLDPIKTPECSFTNHQRDGHMQKLVYERQTKNKGELP
jgi:catalase